MNFNSPGCLASAEFADQALRDAIEQRHFGHLVHDDDLADLESARELGPRTIEGGFSLRVDEQVAGFERTDVRQFGRPARILFAFLANAHPGTYGEVGGELRRGCVALGAGSTGRRRPGLGGEVQVFDLGLATAEGIPDGDRRGKVQRSRYVGLAPGLRRGRGPRGRLNTFPGSGFPGRRGYRSRTWRKAGFRRRRRSRLRG